MSQRSETGNLIVRFGLFLLVVVAFLWLRDPSQSIVDILILIAILVLPAAFPLLIILGIYPLILLFRHFLPARKVAPIGKSEIDPGEVSKWHGIGIILTFIGWPIGTILLSWLMNGLAAWYFHQLPAVYVAPIEKFYWFIPALFAGLLFSGMLSNLIIKGWFKSKHEKLSAYYDQMMGFDNQKVNNLIIVGSLFLISAMMFFGLNSYTRFTEEGIHTRRPYSLREEFHAYDEVVAVRQLIRANRPREDQIFMIEYADGAYWRSDPIESHRVPDSYIPIMEYVAHKSSQEFMQIVETANE
jgi:hypothetical protein